MLAAMPGTDRDDILKRAQNLEDFVESGFAVPKPPPAPPLRYTIQNHAVTLNWKAQPGDINPETYTDSSRLDVEIEPQPFEGYRLYKSTWSINGPWTMLAEYDIAGNGEFNDIGIQYEYTDQGLLNNLEYYYSVTAFSKVDKISGFGSLSSSESANAVETIPGTEPPETVGQVAVVPNPYRGDQFYHLYNPPWEKSSVIHGDLIDQTRWFESDRRIQFINLPSPCEIIIYTLSGDVMRTLKHSDQYKGYMNWNLTSNVGQTIASGIYLYTVKDLKNGKVQSGRFVVIK